MFYYYEIQFYGEKNEKDWTYYIESNRKLSNQEVKEKLVIEFLHKDPSLQKHHIENIVAISEVSCREFYTSSGKKMEENLGLYKIVQEQEEDKKEVELLAVNEVQALSFYNKNIRKQKMKNDEKVSIKKINKENLYV